MTMSQSKVWLLLAARPVCQPFLGNSADAFCVFLIGGAASPPEAGSAGQSSPGLCSTGLWLYDPTGAKGPGGDFCKNVSP